MRGSGLRVDTRPSAPNTNRTPASLGTQSQGYEPAVEIVTNHNSHHHPSPFPQYRRQISQPQATMNCYGQHPSLPVPQPPRHTVPVDVTWNRNAQRPPVSVPQYHRYLAQFESAAKHHGHGPSPSSLATQTDMGHWVPNMPNANQAVRHGNQNTGLNEQFRQPASNHSSQRANPPENHARTLLSKSNGSGNQLGRQSMGSSQPAKCVNGHRGAGPAQNISSGSRGLQIHYTTPVGEPVPQIEMRERQAMTAGLERLKMLEQSFAHLEGDHTRRLVALERSHEGLVAYQANGLVRYRNAHGLPSTTSREEIGVSVAEVEQAHTSTQPSTLPCEKNTQVLDDTVKTPPTHTNKPNAPRDDINSCRDTIELPSDIDDTNVTPHHEVQARKAPKVRIGNVRQHLNGQSPKPRASRYNMRERVQGRVQKTTTRGL